MKFAELSDQIRPQKCRMFAFNLVPCLTAVARRPEDSIYECFGAASSKIFASLGQFYTEEEAKVKNFVKSENFCLNRYFFSDFN